MGLQKCQKRGSCLALICRHLCSLQPALGSVCSAAKVLDFLQPGCRRLGAGEASEPVVGLAASAGVVAFQLPVTCCYQRSFLLSCECMLTV